jgi:hypothetical protein
MHYLAHGYHVLLDQLNQLSASLGQQDPNIGAVILFGSIARLTPRWESDADLLFLCSAPHAFITPERAGIGMALFADLTRPDQEWSFIPVVSDLSGSDLPEALLTTIAHDGVLVYQRPGVVLPQPLAQVRPYADWLAQVQLLLERTRPIAPPARPPITG